MSLISRHLPPLTDSKVPFLGKVILLGMLALIGYWVYATPLKATIGLGTFAALIGGADPAPVKRTLFDESFAG